MAIKYVIIDNSYPVLFTGAMAHSDFKNHGFNITSAGFVDIGDPKNPCTYGKSMSLGLEPDKPQDDILIEIMLKRN